MNIQTSQKLSAFAHDTIAGLINHNKFLHPKYFYDATGSRIFEKIMRMPEYYLTDCEYHIFDQQSESICEALANGHSAIDLVELGPGDGLKSRLLLHVLIQRHTPLNYLPVDISKHAVDELVKDLHKDFPSLKIEPKAGDYFDVIKNMQGSNGRSKAVLFLGSNIGNFFPQERKAFLKQLREFTSSGDKVLIGFDLKKSPKVILDAYDDPQGYTRDFNINHLVRINRELDADFDIPEFEHHAVYEPVTGTAKSFLVSRKEQKVNIRGTGHTIKFKKWESIFMELSQKFDLDDIEKMAMEAGFVVKKNFTDRKNYFADSLWERK